MQVRPFRDSDESKIVELWKEVFFDAKPWNEPSAVIARKRNVQPELFLVAEIDDRIVGTVMAGYDGHRGWLNFVAVSPSARRQGVGAAVIAEAERALARMGCTKINLQVRPSNAGAVSFYEEIGYAAEERVSMSKHIS